ncbi:HPr(Ser) kinase/phosphatase [Pseudolysobacter antarcticus]|uniref:HPr kinase/phosphorylase n=1 Tax=Pseudolysobacter antarcticus TaxID=2511995 RepID=A0A411HGN2_9GAMM|nr:HPr(Ser) kinase/phosphatase [Pseudolysobacter antarcticus]QBB69643.1 HPr(Ser) kinase/phosphatase [Pseudolysobacter antarcticus]
MDRLTARELFDSVAERLGLRWIAGLNGGSRAIEPAEKQSRRPSLVGYLNVIYPNKLQIIGTEELNFLDSLDSRQRWDVIQKIMAYKPTALVVTKDQKIPSDMREAADETATPLWSSPNRGHELYTYLHYHLARLLANKVTLHGVLMEVYSIGVLITGESGSGKSELALELLTRGHRLVADDAPEFTQIAPDVVDGNCPEMLQDFLEVRGLGILNIREMFGHTAVKQSKYLRLIVHLTPLLLDDANRDRDGLKRLYGDVSYREVLGVQIPQMMIPVAPGRNLAVLVEAAVRSHMLRTKGIDPAQTFIDRQAHQMKRQAPW